MKFEKAIQNAKASLRASGLELTEAEEALIRANLLGLISDEEFHKKAAELINKQSK